MKRIIIVHRWSGGPDDDWRPWLKSELEKLGYEVLVPEMPDSHTPVIEKWVSYLAYIVGEPDSDTYFIGHSIGCQAILRYLDGYIFGTQQKVGGAVFVAGWFDLKNLEDSESISVARLWIETPINLNKIKTILSNSTLIISDNDPFDSFEYNKKKFLECGSGIVELHGAGHITAESGYLTVPAILSEIIDILEK